MIALCYFEQKEYNELNHQKDIGISGDTILPPQPFPNDSLTYVWFVLTINSFVS